MPESDPQRWEASCAPVRFRDRHDAGRRLARELLPFFERKDAIVLGLARGGVPVAFEISRALHLSLDVFVVRKLGVPSQPELAMGAIASGGVRVLNEEVLRWMSKAEDTLATVTAAELSELERRQAQYRQGRPPPGLKDRTVILTDDGLATGASMRAAIIALREQHCAHIVVAVPVGAPATCAQLAHEADKLVCLLQPKNFSAVGQAYENFPQTSDAEVRELLTQSAAASDMGEHSSS